MPMFDHEGFHPNMLPSSFKKDTRDVIALAVVLGWKCHITTGNSVTIISPGQEKKYHFGMNGRATVNHNRIKRDIQRFADPDRLLLVQIVGENDKDEVGMTASQMLADAIVASDNSDVVDHRPELEAERTEEEKRKAERVKKKPTPAAMPAKVDRSQCERTIVKEGPMLAKASDGLGYDSNAITQREWSDGSTDYKCNDCDYTSPNRLSVRGHISSHRKGKRPAPDRFPAEVPNAAVYKPNKNRVAALAAVLAEMDPAKVSAEDIALAALTWVHEQSRKGTALAEEREPMGPEDVLNRIRALLDDGTESLALQEQNEKIAALTVRVEHAEDYASQLQEQLRLAEERAEKASQTLNTFIELASELRTEKAV